MKPELSLSGRKENQRDAYGLVQLPTACSGNRLLIPIALVPDRSAGTHFLPKGLLVGGSFGPVGL